MTAPWEIIKGIKIGMIRLYLAIPPVIEWQNLISRALINMSIALAKGIKATPKALFKAGKYIAKRTWKGIKSIPRLVKKGVKQVWSGLHAVSSVMRELLFRYAIVFRYGVY
jgi:hypothetical protein